MAGKRERVFEPWQRHVIGDLTAEALAHKKARGEAVSRPGYGQRIQDGRLVADEAEVAVMGRVAEMRAGGMRLQAIADVLTADGVPTKRGGQWRPCQVWNIIKRSGC